MRSNGGLIKEAEEYMEESDEGVMRDADFVDTVQLSV
jgi:hypothetical protein